MTEGACLEADNIRNDCERRERASSVHMCVNVTVTDYKGDRGPLANHSERTLEKFIFILGIPTEGRQRQRCQLTEHIVVKY